MDAATPKLSAALSNAAATLKATAGKLRWYEIFNPSAATAYVQLFDKATPTVGTDTPVLSLGVPAGGRISGDAYTAFYNAITAAATTTPGGNTAPATPLVANFGIR